MITDQELTLDKFLNLPQDDNTYELIDGKAIPKMSPKRFHSRLTVALCLILEQWRQNKNNQGEVGIEWSVVLQKDGKDWVPVPDLLYLSNDRLPSNRFQDEACPFPPELVIEIISPGQTFGELTEKATAYLKAGVARVWIIDPHVQTITVFFPNSIPETKKQQDSLKDELFPSLDITVNDIFLKAGW